MARNVLLLTSLMHVENSNVCIIISKTKVLLSTFVRKNEPGDKMKLYRVSHETYH